MEIILNGSVCRDFYLGDLDVSDDDKLQARIDPRTSLNLISLERAGIKRKDVMAAAVDALRMVLARNGKCGGGWKASVLSEEQQGTLAYQKLIDLLEDSDAWYKFKSKPDQPKKETRQAKESQAG